MSDPAEDKIKSAQQKYRRWLKTLQEHLDEEPLAAVEVLAAATAKLRDAGVELLKKMSQRNIKSDVDNLEKIREELNNKFANAVSCMRSEAPRSRAPSHTSSSPLPLRSATATSSSRTYHGRRCRRCARELKNRRWP